MSITTPTDILSLDNSFARGDSVVTIWYWSNYQPTGVTLRIGSHGGVWVDVDSQPDLVIRVELSTRNNPDSKDRNSQLLVIPLRDVVMIEIVDEPSEECRIVTRWLKDPYTGQLKSRCFVVDLPRLSQT